MEENILIASYLKNQWSIAVNDRLSIDEIKEALSQHIHYLINHDFTRLIRMLYTVDVNESKLKYLLSENSDADAGDIIARLIIERQLQKIKNRQNTKPDSAPSDEERW